jgi:hypothetical protein
MIGVNGCVVEMEREHPHPTPFRHSIMESDQWLAAAAGERQIFCLC